MREVRLSTDYRPLFVFSIGLINEYLVGTSDVKGRLELFESLWNASTIWVRDANCAFFLSLSRERRPLSPNSVISFSILKHFHSHYPLGQISNRFGDALIPFLASKLHELKSSELDILPLPTLSLGTATL
jgi:hypothetical protein